MHAYKLNVNVAEDHRLALELPADFPAGPAEVIALAVPHVERKLVKLMGSLGGAAAGTCMPADTDPIADALGELRAERAARLGTA